VTLELASSTSGNRYVKSIKRASAPLPPVEVHGEMVDADTIPF
jgi:hypothetical protein